MAAQRDAGMMAKPTGANQYVDRVENGPEAQITLAEAGIDKNLADRARKLAAIPATEFDGIVTECRDRIEQENERVTVNLLDVDDKHVHGTFGTGENVINDLLLSDLKVQSDYASGQKISSIWSASNPLGPQYPRSRCKNVGSGRLWNQLRI